MTFLGEELNYFPD